MVDIPFYVYSLSDPIGGKPFYIGKGQGKRIDAHEKEAKKGVRGPKCDKIREIWSYGLKVKKAILKGFDSENDALEYEFQLINEIGLENLTNIFHGGLLGVAAFLERRERRRKAKAKRMAEIEFKLETDRIAWSAKRQMQRIESYYGNMKLGDSSRKSNNQQPMNPAKLRKWERKQLQKERGSWELGGIQYRHV